MYQLLESIYLNNGVFRNVPYHEARMRRALKELFNIEESIQLIDYFTSMSFPVSGLFKARIMYDTEIRKLEFIPYAVRPVQSLKLIYADRIQYDHKFLDRSELNALYEQRGEADEILIVKNGFITDTSNANVIFKKDNKWFTPVHYLLKGTMRHYLLDTGRIKEAVIDEKNYLHYESVRFINSMLGMNGTEISLKSIVR